MYSRSREVLLAGRSKARVEAFVPKERPMEPRGPITRNWVGAGWSGRFMPKVFRRLQEDGMLRDDWDGNTGPQQESEGLVPLVPREIVDFPSIATAPNYRVPVTSPTVGASSSGGSIWDSLFSGIAKIATPAAQSLVAIKAQGMVDQQKQKTLAQTWNTGLTSPALQAQAYQSAFMSGSGASPISTTTLVVGGLVALGLVMAITRK